MTTTCPACGDPVIKVFAHRKPLLLSAAPSPAGTWAVTRFPGPPRRLEAGDSVLAYETQHAEHAPLCSAVEPVPSVTEPHTPATGEAFLADWKAAQARQNADKRRRPWRKREKPISGIRINPGRN